MEWRGSRDKLTEGSLPSLVSIVRGNTLLSPVYWLLFMSFIIPITFSLWPTSESETRSREDVCINMSKIGSVWIPLLVQTFLFGGTQRWLLCICQQGRSSLHQWHAIQEISISWRPTPLTPPLPPRVSRLHFRS